MIAPLGALGISFSAIFVRLAQVSPATAAFFRAAYAIGPLALLWWMTRERDERTSAMRGRAFVAGLFLACDLSLWHRSIAYIGAGLATVLANVQVVFVGIAAWAIHGERPSNAAFALVPAVLVGVVLTAGPGSDAYGADPVLGVVLGLLAGVAYSGFLLVLRGSNPVLAPSAGPVLDATFGTAVGSFALGLFEPDFSLALHFPAHTWLIALGLLAHALGWLLLTTSLPRLAALETSVILLLQPMFTMIWGFAIFGEAPSSVQLTGAALILGGVTALGVLGSVAQERS